MRSTVYVYVVCGERRPTYGNMLQLSLAINFGGTTPPSETDRRKKTVTAQGEETVRNTIATIRIPNSALMVAIAAMAERGELSQQWPHA